MLIAAADCCCYCLLFVAAAAAVICCVALTVHIDIRSVESLMWTITFGGTGGGDNAAAAAVGTDVLSKTERYMKSQTRGLDSGS